MNKEDAEVLLRFVQSNRPDTMGYAYSFSGLPTQVANDLMRQIEAEYERVMALAVRLVKESAE